ncbi:MAG TPA: TonB-dependent receptor [Leeuwenhoekiella sp.]|nr:TonB-dependent receptor [Leeuwenhoekiella sp.]
MKILLTRLRLVAVLFTALFLINPVIPLWARPHNSSPPSLIQQTVNGTVSDTDGLPLPGVTVMIKNNKTGTSTDLDGNYSINAVAGDTLVFSYVGFKIQEQPVAAQNRIDIQLKEAATALDAVTINAGYYSTTQREATGSIAKVTGEEIQNQPVISPLEALQGRVAGLQIVQETGIPGAAPSVKIRGRNSLRSIYGNNGNLPLYIIDGVPINSAPIQSLNQFISGQGVDPLSNLNPSHIESIEILKDADATAIYGSRGANGVILITTKTGKGVVHKTEVDLRYYGGISRVDNFVDLLDTQQYLDLRRRAFENDEVQPTEANAPDLILWDQNRYTDWQKKLFGGTAQVTNLSFDISGGNKTTSFRLGAGYQNQGTVFPDDHSFEKKTVNLNLNHQTEGGKFKMNLTVNYSINNNDLFSSGNFVSDALSLPPNAPELYNEDGSLNWENSTWDNPLAQLEREGSAEVNNLVSNLGLQYELARGLLLKANLGYTYLDSEDVIKIPLESSDPAIWDRISQRSSHNFVNRKSWIAEPQLGYNLSLKKHEIDALLGATFQESEDSSLGFTGRGYSNKQFIGNLDAADAISTSRDQTLIYKYNAVFARFGYNWDRRYFLNLTGRRDGSSRFGPDKRFANFGAVGAAWILSREKFMESQNILSFGKIRGSYGLTGSDQIGDYRYLDTYEATPGPGGIYPTQLTNPKFSWETNKKLEAGLELGFFADRISFNVNWYRNRSSSQLVGYPLPAITGFNTVEANLPATVENTGWELEISSLNLDSKTFKWRTSVNFTIPKNRLIEFPNIEQTSYSNSFEVGKSLNIARLYKYNGVNPETGLFQVVDANEDGRLDSDDQIVSVDLGRDFYGGFGNQLSYGNMSLNFLFEFVKQEGRKFYNGVPGFRGNSIDYGENTFSSRTNESNGQIPTQSIDGLISYLNAYNSDFIITDASFIRLKTFSMGYDIPKEILGQVQILSAQIFVHGQNLFTISDYPGQDPQNPGVVSLPVLQSITAGINLKF